MLASNIIFSLILIVASLLGGFWSFKSRQRFNLNQKVADDLEEIIANTLALIQTSPQLQCEAITLETNPDVVGATGDLDLKSPETLSTLVTVLVNKYGDVKLTMRDFEIPESDYVSVYVDTAPQEIILSMTGDLDKAAEYSTINYGAPDDTYH